MTRQPQTLESQSRAQKMRMLA